MARIVIHIEDSRFDDMNTPADEVPALLFEMIGYHLWNITDPQIHVSQIDLLLPLVEEDAQGDQIVSYANPGQVVSISSWKRKIRQSIL